MSVLHTWGQNLSHHPHIHCVVAGGAWDAQRKAFIKAPNPRFLFSVRAMSKVFRGKMLADLRDRCCATSPATFTAWPSATADSSTSTTPVLRSG